MKKWIKYTIDYEYGRATLISKDRSLDWNNLFYALASECFGIRKSIGEISLIDEELIDFDGSEKGIKNSGENIMNMGGGDYTGTMLHAMLNKEVNIDIPKEKLELVEHILAHGGGDVIVFSKTKDSEGNYWKLKDEFGYWCTCENEGTADLSCENHHFWVKDHDKICNCQIKS